MRPGQQNKRGRGRNNNNSNNGRKGGNPLSRSYDSSGPDVKIRGTAQHIAEKYANLARDAQSSGDNVMAENYFQHAEHYNRIIAAAQAQMQERFQRDERDGNDRDDDRDEHEGDERGGNRERGEHHQRASEHEQESAEQPALAHVNGSGPQPVIEGTPAELSMDEDATGGTPRRGPGRRRSAASRPRRQPRDNGGDDDSASKPADSGRSDNPEAAGEGSGKGETPVAAAASE